MFFSTPTGNPEWRDTFPFSTTIYLRYLRVSVSFTSAAITSFHQTCYIFLTATNQHIDTSRGMYVSVMQQKCLQWRIGTGARCDLPYERKPNMKGLQVAESYLTFPKIIYQRALPLNIFIKLLVSR